MAFTVIHDSVSRIPTYEELCKLAATYEVHLIGDKDKGTFSKDGDPKVEGDYEFTDLGLNGKFSAHMPMGSVAGNFQFSPQQAEVEVTHKPFFVPEALLRTKITEGLSEFFNKFAV